MIPTTLTSMLEGYAFSEWPDLSADRSPLNRTQITANELPTLGSCDNNLHIPLVISAIARTIGAYCGTSDLLLALATDVDGVTNLLRVTWNNDQSWEELILHIKDAIVVSNGNPISLPELRTNLALSYIQHPCLALCLFNQADFASNSEYPTVFSFNVSSGILQLSSSLPVLHPTVATQVLAQVHGVVQWALQHPLSKVVSVPSLPSDLLSVSERGTNEDLAKAYPHIPFVSFAPDYLALRAQDMSRTTAVRWYPELSTDSPNLHFESLSYADLDAKANQVAHWLRRNGLQQEGRVGVCLDRNLNFHAAMMGVMRAGGCYVPIDPELPLERKVYIAKDANAAFVLTSSQIAASDVFGSITLYIEDNPAQLEISRESVAPLDYMKPDNLAYLLYTSGTTGNPKGCLLTHRGLAQAILALSSTAADVRMENIHEGRYLAVASIAFDVHLAETIVPFALGMPLISARRSQLLENLPIYVNNLGITHLGIVPSLIEATLNAAQSGDEMPLRYIASGGEKMSDSILDKWADHPQVRLANFYGPSEVTIGCCGRYMTSVTPRANIGRALACASSYVVDSAMNILLKGSVGELVVEGPLVGRGYQGRPDLTEKVFLEWPRAGCWAYRTGDLVRMMPDSTIEIVGRIDTQIKLRGVRIESEGISAIVRNALPQSEPISLDVTTILAKHPVINVEQLVSLYSWDKTVPISTRKSKKPHVVTPPPGLVKSIKSKCEKDLPGYMRPGHLIPLSWLPLSSNGKTDAKVLARLFCDLDIEVLAKISIAEDVKDYRPCTDTEKKIFAILQNHVAMPLENPYPELSVFECGLDSMGVIRFTTELKAIFNAKISASVVMKCPRISDIASQLQLGDAALSSESPSFKDEAAGVYADPTLPYHRDQIENILPPFPVQEGVLARSAESDNLYVQHVVLSLNISVSVPRLRTAWSVIVRGNPILRTVFHFGRTLSQIVLKSDVCTLNWETHELPFLHEESPFAAYFLHGEGLTVVKDINNTLSSIVPYRLTTYSSHGRIFLVLSIHHALFDGISLPRLFQEVEHEYLNQVCAAPVSSLDILAHMSSVSQDDAKHFWTEYFAGFSWTQPTLVVNPHHETQHQVVPFEASLSSLKALAASQQVTIQALLTSAFALLLCKDIFKRRDVVFGVVRSGRLLPIDNIDDAICPLVSVVPTRVNFDSPDVSLQAIQQGISSIVEYEHIPLGKVQAWVRPGRSLFDVLFSLSINRPSLSELWHVVESEPPKADYALSVEVVLNPAEDTLRVQAAWVDQEQDVDIRKCLCELEDTVHGLANDSSLHILHSLAEIPITLNHKTEAESQNGLNEDNVFDADPELLETLRHVIAEFLQIQPAILNPSTSFISMGLDSIKSVGLARTITRGGYSVTSSDILRNATLHQIASYIFSQSSQAKVAQDVDTFNNSIVAVDRDIVTEILSQGVKLTHDDHVELFPTTALQTGMLSQTINSGGKLYLHSFPLRLVKEFDAVQLRAAWDAVVEKFPILRTSFHFSTDIGVWVQATHSDATLNWAEHTVKSVEEYDQVLQLFLGSIKLDDEASFKHPPFWVRLFNHGTTGSSLVFVMHHALYDGASIGLLVNAVEAFYQSRPCQYETQFHQILPHILVQQRDGVSFWKQKLDDLKPLRLPRMHFARNSVATTLEKYIPLNFHRVKAVLSQASVTMQCVGQAAWAKVIGKHTCSPDVVFGHTVSGRNIPGSEEVIGPVLNTIPCCVRLQPDLDNLALLKIIHQGNLDALPYQQAAARDIQKALRVDRLWDSLFLFQSADSGNLPSPDHPVLWTFDENSGDRDAKIQYPLNIEVSHSDTGIVIRCASDPNFVDAAYLAKILTDFNKFLIDIVDQPHERAFAYPDIFSKHDSHLGVAFSTQRDIQTHSQAPQKSPFPSQIDPSIYEPILVSVTNAPRSLIRPETHLVTIGVDSITAIQIAGKFRQAGFMIAASDVVSSVTIGQMIAKMKILDTLRQVTRIGSLGKCDISDQEKEAIGAQLTPLPSSIESINVASSGMQWLIGMWGKSKRTRYQHVFPFELPKHIDRTRMKASWFALLDRHPILRSTFVCADGYHEPRVVTFSSSSPATWSEEGVSAENFSDLLLERMKTMVLNPIPTSQSQAKAVFYHSSGHSYLLLHLHHFQYDAWSLRLLINDLSSLYAGTQSVVTSNMASFLGHYAMSNIQHLEEQQSYWKTSFPSTFKPLLFPVLRSDTSAHGPVERIIRTDSSCIQNASRLDSQARSLGVSLQAVFLASWARIQGQISKTSSSTFGLWQSGRTGILDGIDNLAIPCMNVLPMHVPCVDEKPALDLARAVLDDLHKRTSVVEQSNQVRVNEWVGASKEPICNVFINIVKVAHNVPNDDQILKFIEVPYYVPSHTIGSDNFPSAALEIMHILKDDLFVDFATIESTDTVMMSIDSVAYLMDNAQADDLMLRWSGDVQRTLGVL